MGATGRRMISVPGLILVAVLLTLTCWLWVPLAAIADLVRLKRRLPTVRLLAFATWWAWLETVGVVVAGALWITGQRRRLAPHYALQRWWAGNLLRAMRVTCGMTIEREGIELLSPGPTLLFARHVSLADSVVTTGAVIVDGGQLPRVVLKRELTFDPCLDIVGNRIPNHFLDRSATDSAGELDALRALAAGMTAANTGVIFPEGTRANPKKRARALEKIAERDPARAERLKGLQVLIPPRPSGAKAMVEGAPSARILLAWHVGLEGMDDFAGILRVINRGPIRVEYHIRAVDPPASGEDFTEWLDAAWLRIDAEAAAALARRAA